MKSSSMNNTSPRVLSEKDVKSRSRRQATNDDKNKRRCYKCRKSGHTAADCQQPDAIRHVSKMSTPPSAPPTFNDVRMHIDKLEEQYALMKKLNDHVMAQYVDLQRENEALKKENDELKERQETIEHQHEAQLQMNRERHEHESAKLIHK